MTKRLEGKIAVVTGSGQGVDRGIAIVLAREGAKVVTNNRTPGITFEAMAEMPPNSGRIVNIEWDFDGSGNFTESLYTSPVMALEMSATFTYNKPGTYFPAVRFTSQREGDRNSVFAKVPTLGCARVVVR